MDWEALAAAADRSDAAPPLPSELFDVEVNRGMVGVVDGVRIAIELPFECEGDARETGGGGVGSGAGCNSDETLGGFGVLTGSIGPFDERLGDGLGTGIIDVLEVSAGAPDIPVGVGGIPDRELLLMLLNDEAWLLFCK